MKNNNIRTMEFIGIDFWSRPVYKCVETSKLWKDITLGSETPDLYSCHDFEGEPDCPIKSDLEIKFINKYVENPNSFNYQMLDRLKSDCDYYLGYGNRNKNQLYYHDEQEQINKMKELHNGFSAVEKPEWLTFEQILSYEKLMVTSI